MENRDLAEVDSATGCARPPEPTKLPDQVSGCGESRLITRNEVTDADSVHEPRQDAGADASFSEAAPISVAEHPLHAAGAVGGPSAEDSIALVRLLMAAVQQVHAAGLNSPNTPTSQPVEPVEVKDAAIDEDRRTSEIRPQARDEVQLVEIRNPEGTGWSAMSNALREYDEEEIGYYKDDIDTLLVFAGLYSAVLSAFIIDSYTFLQPDPEDKMIFLFQNMVSQNYTMSNGFLNATNPYPVLPDFEAPTWAIRVNVLWFSSLVVSLAAASYGMLVKQWLREYLNMAGITAPRERLRARQYRRPALDRWMVFEIAASLPLLLEIALGLFFIGLCYFTTAIHSSISRSTIPFVAAWAFFFIAATVAPLVSPRCPFKTTILRAVLRQGRKAVYVLTKLGVRLCYPLRKTMSFIRGHFLYRIVADGGKYCYIVLRECAAFLHEHPILGYVRTLVSLLKETIVDVFGTEEEIKFLLGNLDAHMEEEKIILEKKQDDLAILRSVEEIMPGDGLLPTLVDVASAANPPWYKAFALMKTVIDNRTGRDMNLSEPSTWNDSLQLLSQQSCDALTGWVSHIISCHKDTPSAALGDTELAECAALFCCLVFSHTRPLSDHWETTLYDLIFRHKIYFSALLFRSETFKYRIRKLFSSSNVDKTRMSLSHAEWVAGAENLILRCDNVTDGDIQGGWIPAALARIIFQWQTPSSRGLPEKNRLPHPFTNRIVEKLLDKLCRIECRGRIFGIRGSEVDVFYGILLCGATSNQGEWQYSSKLFARNLTSICILSEAQPYRRGEDEGPTSPKKAFLTLMKSYSETWMETLLGWLAPHRMPGNILAEIVAADLAACEPDDQRRKLDEIIHICRIASLEISPPESYSTDDGIDFSTLLQIVILLQRDRVLDGEVSKEKVRAIQTALGAAVIRRHTAHRVLINFRLRNNKFRGANRLINKMRAGRLDLVHAMSYGCYGNNGWAGVINQCIRKSEYGILWLQAVGRLRLLVGEAWMEKRTEQIQNKDGGRRASQPSRLSDSNESNSLDH